MVSQPVCGASGPGHAARAQATGLPHRGAPPGRAAAHSLPIAGRAVRALGHVPERLKEGASSAHCLEADRGCDLRCITLQAVVHGSSVGQKMVSAKRGFSPEHISPLPFSRIHLKMKGLFFFSFYSVVI